MRSQPLSAGTFETGLIPRGAKEALGRTAQSNVQGRITLNLSGGPFEPSRWKSIEFANKKTQKVSLI